MDDGDSNLTSVRDAENNLYEYEYNDEKQVTKATAPLGQTVNYNYKSKGPVLNTIIASADGKYRIRSGYLYNEASGSIAAQAYAVTEKDQHGYATDYEIDLQKGLTNKCCI